MGASAEAWVSTSNVPVGTPSSCSTARWTGAEKYGAGRPAAAWRAGYQTRIGSVLGLPVAGSMRDASARNPDRTPIGHGPVGAGSVNWPVVAAAARGAGEDTPAARLAPAAPGTAASSHAATNTPTTGPRRRRRVPVPHVRYTTAASLVAARLRPGTRRYAAHAREASRMPGRVRVLRT